jgi:hypothetical protein
MLFFSVSILIRECNLQIRQIYGFYAMSKDARRHGSGPSKLLLGFEHCREMMIDFQVLPHVVDAQGYARLFKVSTCVFVSHWCVFRAVVREFSYGTTPFVRFCKGQLCAPVFPASEFNVAEYWASNLTLSHRW